MAIGNGTLTLHLPFVSRLPDLETIIGQPHSASTLSMLVGLYLSHIRRGRKVRRLVLGVEFASCYGGLESDPR